MARSRPSATWRSTCLLMISMQQEIEEAHRGGTGNLRRIRQHELSASNHKTHSRNRSCPLEARVMRSSHPRADNAASWLLSGAESFAPVSSPSMTRQCTLLTPSGFIRSCHCLQTVKRSSVSSKCGPPVRTAASAHQWSRAKGSRRRPTESRSHARLVELKDLWMKWKSGTTGLSSAVVSDYWRSSIPSQMTRTRSRTRDER